MWNPDTRADTKCMAMEPMCQIMPYNQLPTFDTIHKWTLAQEVGRFHIGACGTRTMGRTPSVGPWNLCVKSCFITNCQLLTPFTSGNWVQKWVGSTSLNLPMWSPDTGADTKFPDMEPMCQIMFYNQLPTSDQFTSKPWLLKWAGFTSVPSLMWNPDSGADTKCQAMEPMCQIMFYNQLLTSDTIQKWSISPPWLQKWAGLTSVPSPIWNPDNGGGHQVSSHGTDLSNHVL